MKRLSALVANDYSIEQALNQMELTAKTGLSAAQMWMQTYNVVKVNWTAFRQIHSSRGLPLVASKFFQSMLAKHMSAESMTTYLGEVYPTP